MIEDFDIADAEDDFFDSFQIPLFQLRMTILYQGRPRSISDHRSDVSNNKKE